MAIAILNRQKWKYVTGDLSIEEKLKAYQAMGGAIFEGTNEEVEMHPKYLAIYDEKKPERKRATKSKAKKK